MELAEVALAQAERESPPGVRQREEIRRALIRVGEALGWATVAAIAKDPASEIRKDLLRVVRKGATSIRRDLGKRLAEKRGEASQLRDVAEEARELAEDPDADYPAELAYCHTGRDVNRSLVTKTTTLTVGEPQEAVEVAETIERNIEEWGELAHLMSTDLENAQKRIDEMRRTLPDFVRSLDEMLCEVIATLH